jgi:hypothetical protein
MYFYEGMYMGSGATHADSLGLMCPEEFEMKRYSSILFVLTVAAGVAEAQTGPAATIVQQYTFAPVGIAAGQTLRLNVANISMGTAACMVNLSFVSSDGVSIKNEDVTVAAGNTMSYPLAATEVSTAVAEIRGVVKIDRQVGGVVVMPGAPVAAVCSAVMSLELVDAMGTRAVLTNPTLVSGFLPVVVNPLPLGVQ